MSLAGLQGVDDALIANVEDNLIYNALAWQRSRAHCSHVAHVRGKSPASLLPTVRGAMAVDAVLLATQAV
jgi:hypothetical protein